MKLLQFFDEGGHVEEPGKAGPLIAVISVIMTAYVVWYAVFAISNRHFHTAAFLTGVLPVLFLTITAHTSRKTRNWTDWVWAVLAAAASAYFVFNWEFYETLIEGVTRISRFEIFMSVVMTVVIIEASRRAVGWGLTGTAVALLAYVVFGHHIGGALGHDPMSIDFYARRITVSEDSLFGVTVEVAATYGFLFVLFGAIYQRAGGGQFFFELSAVLVGRMKGGATKACVISSGIYGSVSGSPTADVMTTGPITIPIMRRNGATAVRAAATEAAASCGGAILPPVMGSVAFLMVEYTGIPYREIALAAVGIGVLYYLGILLITHHESMYTGEGKMEGAEHVGLGRLLVRDFRLVIPLAALCGFIYSGYSPTYVAAGSSAVAFLSSYLTLDRTQWVTPKILVECCVETLTRLAGLTAACAAAGLVIGYLDMTGLVGKFSFMLTYASGGNLALVLIAAAVLLVILGLGLPTAAVYIMGAALVAPVLVADFKMPVMIAHMFMLVFACMSAITPPLAVAAMASAALAGANPDRVGWYGVKLAFVGFLLPFLMVSHPGLILEGSWPEIALALAGSLVCVTCLAYAIGGTIRRSRIPALIRIVLLAIGSLALIPGNRELMVSIVLSVIAILLLMKWESWNHARQPAPSVG